MKTNKTNSLLTINFNQLNTCLMNLINFFKKNYWSLLVVFVYIQYKHGQKEHFWLLHNFFFFLFCKNYINELVYPNIWLILYVVRNAVEWSLKDSHSLTTLMPRDLAEPMMLLTMFCIEMSRSLKLSSCDLTCAISYTALTVTIPAISCPEWRNKVGGEREGWWNTVAQKEKPAGGVVGRDWEKWKWRWSEGER